MKILNTPKAPKAIGPYSQAIIAGEFLFCSGQIGLHPENGELVTGIEGQTKQVLQNINAILENARLTKDDVVKTTIFLSDISTFNIVNELYASFFQNHKPARSTVEVSNLPKGAAIEIEIIAKIA